MFGDSPLNAGDIFPPLSGSSETRLKCRRFQGFSSGTGLGLLLLLNMGIHRHAPNSFNEDCEEEQRKLVWGHVHMHMHSCHVLQFNISVRGHKKTAEKEKPLFKMHNSPHLKTQ